MRSLPTSISSRHLQQQQRKEEEEQQQQQQQQRRGGGWRDVSDRRRHGTTQEAAANGNDDDDEEEEEEEDNGEKCKEELEEAGWQPRPFCVLDLEHNCVDHIGDATTASDVGLRHRGFCDVRLAGNPIASVFLHGRRR